MTAFLRQPTKTTPLVHLDHETGTYLLSGRSIPIDAELFYRPILNWFEQLGKKDKKLKRLELCMRFDFFNIASSKRILFLLYKLAEFKGDDVDVSVKWMYEKTDDDMLEIGQDYAVMIDNIQFEFQAYDHDDIKEQQFLKMG